MSKINKYSQKIEALRALMLKKKIDSYLVSHEDEHLLENSSENFQRLKWLTGFTGSAGYLIVTLNNLYLFVDSRYSIQSKIETKGLKIKIFNVAKLDYEKFIKLNKLKTANIALDCKTISYKLFLSYENAAQHSKLKIISLKNNLVDFIWNRSMKTQNTNKIFMLEQKYCGLSFEEKLKKLLMFLKNKNADTIFIQNSESVSWLFNIRGADLLYTPITFAYSLISKKYIYIFLENSKLSKKIVNFFSKKIKILRFSEIEETLKKINNKEDKILIDTKTTSKYYHDIIKKSYKEIIYDNDPILTFKAIKNNIEIKNIVKAHIFDGVALTKFIYWLKNFNSVLTELDIVNKIDALRSQNKNFLCKSFPTIAGSGKNGAIVHYIPNKITNRKLNKNDILLLDSGGQYKLGTTDVTRTLSIGKPEENHTVSYTQVLKSHIKLSNAIFPEGISGAYLDYLARSKLWEIGKDYAHGTGHGVGYCLNVHEGPFSISKNSNIALKEGMVFSNEPGYYIENKFGIRIENLVTIKKKILNKKDFFKIETLTLAPYDIDLIKKNLLTKSELLWVKNYHKRVFKEISPYLTKNENDWLIKEIKKL
tara:strand:+ start:2428 stop:4206 length:1779 start_codon:yes stop_codon:yes gene_type:complete